MNSIAQLGRTLQAGRLTAAVRRIGAAEFKQRSGCQSVLLVRIPKEEQELAWGLQQTYGAEGDAVTDQPKVLDFNTAIVGAAFSAGGGKRPGARSAVTGFGHDDLIAWISAAQCFAVPIGHREAGFSGRITLGRARNKDLALRSQNISKLHAWFEYDAAGKLLIADAGSKNGTKVGGMPLQPREPVPVANGTEILFGSLETMVCSVEQFWEVASVL